METRAGSRHRPRFDHSFTRLDLALLSIVTCLAGGLRLLHVGRPKALVFDEVYYAQDACWYLHHAARMCGESGPSSTVHPPLAKWLIAGGIAAFGYNPLGWRIAAVLAGTASVALVYLLARRLLGSTVGAAVASGLLCFDFLAFVQSRVGMLDVFVTMFSVATILFAVYDLDASPRARWPSRPWRILTGIAGGAAIACKWSGALALVAAVLLLVIWGWADRPRAGPLRTTVRRAAPGYLLWFAIVPAVVYTATFQGQLYGTWTAVPWSPHSWPRAFLHRQSFMLHFQAGLAGFHPYESPAWSWLLLKRPIVYYFQLRHGDVHEILALGDPLTWWCSIAAVIALAARWVRRGLPRDATLVILVAIAAMYLPWFVLTADRQFVFLYYVLPVIPVLCVALAAVAVLLMRALAGRVVVAVYAAAVIGLFGFFYPVMTASPESYQGWQSRIWFRDCRVTGPTRAVIVRHGRTYPFPGEGHPPAGWCWE
jgi:dolichyl-phosphate-mannose-protein mannosyltransferase